MHKYIRNILVFLSLASITTSKAQQIPTPQEHFGFYIGQDYRLTNYTDTEAYFKRLAASDRVQLVDIGETEEGRRQYMLIVSSPENLAQLEKYREISLKLALAEDLDEEDARALAKQGKAVVWIDGALHSTEMVGTHALIETAYQLASRTDDETQFILDNTIILLVHANPDGHELTGNWYMHRADSTKRRMDIPVLYQKYIGHDNNRDFYITNMKESQNMSRQLFVEWMPQIMYNHHQTAPAGAVVAGPPYVDPFNYAIDPLLMTGIDAVGANMINRLNTEGRPGFTRLRGSPFSTWYNGGLRTTTYFHNIVGILTEIIGGPTPASIPVVPSRMLPSGNTPNPVMPQQAWHFKQSIDYSLSMNYAVLDYAARHRDQVLYNIYRMGRNSIEKGSQDSWILTPRTIDRLEETYRQDLEAGEIENAQETTAFANRNRIPYSYYERVFKDPALRDARGYIIPASQHDFATAVKFVNALAKSGIFIHQATADFSVDGKTYPAGSFVVKTDQAFRPHILDMFEPQDYPNDFLYPGAPPTRPYDVAGWTLAYQMNIEFDRILDDFDGPFERLPHGEVQAMPASEIPTSAHGYFLSGGINDNYIAVNALLKAGVDVFRTAHEVQGLAAGSFYVPANGMATLRSINADHGFVAVPASSRPAGLSPIAPTRIALYDRYGGSMPSGWVRWILEQYGYDYQLIYPAEINAGDLIKKYDVILFIGPGIPSFNAGNATRGQQQGATNLDDIPEAYAHMVGSLTATESVPALRSFAEQGGTVVTVGASTSLAYHFQLPVSDALTEIVDGELVRLPSEKYFVPGSVLRMQVDTQHPANAGMNAQTDVMFTNSPVFRLEPLAAAAGVEALAWFGTENPLRSGWAWGASYLRNGVTAFVAPVGQGKLYAFGPEITYRAQAHGTFKLLFNTLYQPR